MKKLIREAFELWVRMRWLKQIDRENKKVSKYRDLYQHHVSVREALYQRYFEIYGSKKEEKSE